MIPAHHSSAFRRARSWPLCAILMALPVACTPQMATNSASEEPITGMTDGNGTSGGTSLVGTLDAGPVMPDSMDPGQSFSQGLAESSTESETSEESVVDLATSTPEALPVEGPSVEIKVPSKDLEPSLLPLPLAKVDLALAQLAAEADDPVVYEFVRSMLPILAMEGVGADDLDFQPSTEDLLAEEFDMLEAVSDFAVGVRTGMASGVPPKELLIERLSELLERLRNESGLRMGRVELCTSIAGYGDVEVTSPTMAAGRDQEILVYAELDGLDWVSKTNGKVGWDIRYRLQLHQMSDGMVIDPGVESSVSDTLVAPVENNYLWIRYRLPAQDLNAGRYILKLWIREPSTNREDERSIEIDLLPERLIGRTVTVSGS